MQLYLRRGLEFESMVRQVFSIAKSVVERFLSKPGASGRPRGGRNRRRLDSTISAPAEYLEQRVVLAQPVNDGLSFVGQELPLFEGAIRAKYQLLNGVALAQLTPITTLNSIGTISPLAAPFIATSPAAAGLISGATAPALTVNAGNTTFTTALPAFQLGTLPGLTNGNLMQWGTRTYAWTPYGGGWFDSVLGDAEAAFYYGASDTDMTTMWTRSIIVGGHYQKTNGNESLPMLTVYYANTSPDNASADVFSITKSGDYSWVTASHRDPIKSVYLSAQLEQTDVLSMWGGGQLTMGSDSGPFGVKLKTDFHWTKPPQGSPVIDGFTRLRSAFDIHVGDLTTGPALVLGGLYDRAPDRTITAATAGFWLDETHWLDGAFGSIDYADPGQTDHSITQLGIGFEIAPQLAIYADATFLDGNLNSGQIPMLTTAPAHKDLPQFLLRFSHVEAFDGASNQFIMIPFDRRW